MPSPSIFACTSSRLHTDVAVIRLRRAGISIDQISAVFPQKFSPNTVFFWLKNPHPCRPAGIFVAGPVAELCKQSTQIVSLIGKLAAWGLDVEMAGRCLDKIRRGRTLLCVQTKDLIEAAAALRTFKHVKAENIVFVSPKWEKLPPQSPVEHRLRRVRTRPAARHDTRK